MSQTPETASLDKQFLNDFKTLDAIERAIFLCEMRELADNRITTEEFISRVKDQIGRRRAGQPIRLDEIDFDAA